MKRVDFQSKFISYVVSILFLVSVGFVSASAQGMQSNHSQKKWVPKRVNKCIELLKAGQPIYYAAAYGGYKEGVKMAKTWADYIMYDMENHPLDISKLHAFMQGLVDGGPTPSGHRTPAVIVCLPAYGLDSASMLANVWMFQQVLDQGVHGIELCHARNPKAIKVFVQACRYPIHKQAIKILGEGLRGYGSQKFAAYVWGISQEEYFKKADVWPLNPNGELMLGIKIEDRHALANTDKSLQTPGLCFAEWGPRDMGLSYGLLGGQADPPFTKVLKEAGEKVEAACKKYHIFFLDNVTPQNVVQRIKEGVMIGAGRIEKAAEIGREYTKRKMPWK